MLPIDVGYCHIDGYNFQNKLNAYPAEPLERFQVTVLLTTEDLL